MGRVKILSPAKSNYGYVQFKLGGRKGRCVFIHRIIWETFMGKIPLGLEINHKDGIKSNNKLSNLEICTSSENQKHAYQTNLKLPVIGEDHGQSKLLEIEVVKIKKMLIERRVFRREIAKLFGVSLSTINAINCGRLWKHVKV